MLIVKILSKILAIPLIIAMTVIVGICKLIESIGGFVVGLYNLVLIIGGICALIDTGSFDLTKKIFIFLIVENVIFAVLGLGVSTIVLMRDKLMDYMFA